MRVLNVWSILEKVWPFIIQKKLDSSTASIATSQARKKIISLFLLSPPVLSSSTLRVAPSTPVVATICSMPRYSTVHDKFGPLPRPSRLTKVSIPIPAIIRPVIFEDQRLAPSTDLTGSNAVRCCTGTSN